VGKNLKISILYYFYFLHTRHGEGMHTAAFQWVNPKETDYWDDLSIVGRITLIHILRRRIWTRIKWLIKWASGEHP
jgi:hypothetical protein